MNSKTLAGPTKSMVSFGNTELSSLSNNLKKQATFSSENNLRDTHFGKKLENENVEIEDIFSGANEKILLALDGLRKPSGQRNLKEQMAIIKLIENSSFMIKMKAYTKNLPHQVANCVKIERIQKGQHVFMAGERPEKFYLIAQGKVSVLAPKTYAEMQQLKADQIQNTLLTNDNNHEKKQQQEQQQDGDEDLLIPENSNISKRKRKFDEFGNNLIETTENNEKPWPDISLWKSQIFNWKQYYIQEGPSLILKFNHIKFLSEGEVFGEFGLIVRKPRSATILAVEETFVLTISKQEYEELLREIQFSKMERKTKRLLKRLKLDETKLKPEWINGIMLDFSTKKYLKQGWAVFNQGDPADSVFLIKSGEIGLVKSIKIPKDPNIHRANSSSLSSSFTTSALDQQSNEDVLTIYPEDSTVSSKKQGEPSHLSGQQASNISTNRSRIVNVKFGILSSNEFVGLEDLFFNKKIRTHSAVCLSDVTVYFLRKSQLHRLIDEVFLLKVELQKQAMAKHVHHAELIKSMIFIQTQVNSSFKENTRNNSKNVIPEPMQLIKLKQVSSHSFSTSAAGVITNENTNSVSYQNQGIAVVSPSHKQEQQSPLLKSQNASKIKQQIENDLQDLQGDSLQQAIKEFQLPVDSDIPEDPLFLQLDLDSRRNQKSASTHYENPFWFDQNLKIKMDKKIHFSLHEKDPQYIKLNRATFKGNIEQGKYGTLDKKINRVLKQKPKLISNTVLNSPINNNNNNNNILSPRVAGGNSTNNNNNNISNYFSNGNETNLSKNTQGLNYLNSPSTPSTGSFSSFQHHLKNTATQSTESEQTNKQPSLSSMNSRLRNFPLSLQTTRLPEFPSSTQNSYNFSEQYSPMTPSALPSFSQSKSARSSNTSGLRSHRKKCASYSQQSTLTFNQSQEQPFSQHLPINFNQINTNKNKQIICEPASFTISHNSLLNSPRNHINIPLNSLTSNQNNNNTINCSPQVSILEPDSFIQSSLSINQALITSRQNKLSFAVAKSMQHTLKSSASSAFQPRFPREGQTTPCLRVQISNSSKELAKRSNDHISQIPNHIQQQATQNSPLFNRELDFSPLKDSKQFQIKSKLRSTLDFKASMFHLSGNRNTNHDTDNSSNNCNIGILKSN